MLLESKIKLLNKTSDLSRNRLNQIICSLQLILDNFCDNREEEIEYLKQSRDSAIALLAVLEEFINLLQKEREEEIEYLQQSLEPAITLLGVLEEFIDLLQNQK